MKKRLFFLTLSLFVSIMSQADGLTPDFALNRIKDSNLPYIVTNIESANLAYTEYLKDNNSNEDCLKPAWYAFNKDNSGWIILSADDCSAPVLAYSDQGLFNPSNIPANMKWWLEQYTIQVSNARCKWVQEAGEDRAQITPMIKTAWDQNSPFNLYTPQIDGKNTPTGCVATAMAQFMKYYNYPQAGTGTLSYIMNGTPLSLNLDELKFDWDKMTDTYFHDPSESQKEAVAKLMQACGYAVDSEYTALSTNASVYLWPKALISNFGYSPSSDLISRVYYNNKDWEDLIYNSLKAGIPVLYSGLGSNGGHAFLCDGYASGGFFHFNWGWAGLSDGYFLLSALNPTALGTGGGAGGFNSGQIALVNCTPGNDGSEIKPKMGITEGTEISYSNISKNFTLLGTLMNLTPKELKVKVGFEIEDIVGNKIYAGESNASIEIDVQGKIQTYARKAATTLGDGNYTVRPVFGIEHDGTTVWSKVLIPVNCPQYWKLEISNGKGTISGGADNRNVKVTGLRATTSGYVSSQFKVAAEIENLDTLEFMSDVYVVLYNKNGDFVYASDANPVDIMPLSNEEVDFTCVTAGVNVPAGEYDMALALVRNKQLKEFDDISGRVTFVMNPFQNDIVMEATDFGVEDSQTVNPSAITLSMKLKCINGYYANPIRVWVRPSGSTGSWGQMMLTQHIYMNQGDTQPVSYTFYYPKATSNTEYELIANYIIPQSQAWLGTCTFKTSETSSVTPHEALSDEPDGETRYFNLQGFPAKPDCPGVYIMVKNGKSSKIIIN